MPCYAFAHQYFSNMIFIQRLLNYDCNLSKQHSKTYVHEVHYRIHFIQMESI